MRPGSLVAWKSARSVRSVTRSLSLMGAAYRTVGWPASQSGTGFGGRLDAHVSVRPGADQGRSGTQAGEAPGDRRQLAAGGHRRAAEAQRVPAAVAGVELDSDRDEGGHAHHRRSDVAVDSGEEGE